MSKAKMRISKPLKRTKPAGQLKLKPASKQRQRTVQAVTPEAAGGHAHFSPNGVTAADLGAMQRAVGNRNVQRIMVQRSDNANVQPGLSAIAELRPRRAIDPMPTFTPTAYRLQPQKKGADSKEASRTAELRAKYEAVLAETAVKPEAWAEAAVLLNGFDTSNILDMLRKLTPEQWKAMSAAAPGWVVRVREPLDKLLNVTGQLEDKQFKQIKAESLKDEKARVKKLKEDFETASKEQDWVQASVLLNGFSDRDIDAMLKKLSKSQRAAMFYTIPDSANRIKKFIADMDKIGKAAAVSDSEFEKIKQLYPDGITVAIYANYKVGVSGAAEFKRAGEEFAKNQTAIALSGDRVVIGGATPISDLSEVTIAIQRIHQGLVEKHRQSQQTPDAKAPPPKFTKIRNLALFAHGEPYGVGLDRSNRFELLSKNVKTFVGGLRSAITENVNVQLFACSTAADRALIKSKGEKTASYIEWTEHKQDERKASDSFAAALATELGSGSTVVGHTTVGHTTENYAARVFGKGAGGGTGGLHIFDLMYTEVFIQDELKRLFPDKTDSERADLHDSLREQMWAHFKDSISTEHKRKPKERRYSQPMGQEMFVNPGNAEQLLHKDWEENWIPGRLKQVKPVKPRSK